MHAALCLELTRNNTTALQSTCPVLSRAPLCRFSFLLGMAWELINKTAAVLPLRHVENELIMSVFALEGRAYLSFFDDGSWFQVKFRFVPFTFAIAKATDYL